MNGLHYSDTMAGRVFSTVSNQTSIAGLAIPIFSATAVAGGNPILNPNGSNRNVELISVQIDYTSGTAAFEPIGIMVGDCAGIGTATGCSAFADGNTYIRNGLYGGGNASKVFAGVGGTVTVTAGTATPPVPGVIGAGWLRSLASINLEAQTGTAHGTQITKFTFDGTLVLTPGHIIYLASVASTTALYNITWVWKEIPINVFGG